MFKFDGINVNPSTCHDSGGVKNPPGILSVSSDLNNLLNKLFPRLCFHLSPLCSSWENWKPMTWLSGVICLNDMLWVASSLRWSVYAHAHRYTHSHAHRHNRSVSLSHIRKCTDTRTHTHTPWSCTRHRKAMLNHLNCHIKSSLWIALMGPLSQNSRLTYSVIHLTYWTQVDVALLD